MSELRPGDFWVICDRSGFKVPASQTVVEWTGSRVWRKLSEDRHPQEFIRTAKDDQRVNNPRAEPEDVFLSTNEVTAGSL